MRNALSRCTPTAGRFVGLIALLALAGCQEDEITHAIVPRSSEPEKTRLLAVIYPHGEQTWFFKLTGPESAVKDAEEPFNDFMHSVKFTNKVDRPVSWTTWRSASRAKSSVCARVAPGGMRRCIGEPSTRMSAPTSRQHRASSAR